MRFARHLRTFRGQLDVLTMTGTLLLLLVVVLLQNNLVFTPGVPIRLPEGEAWLGTTNATIMLAVDARGLVYFQNQWVREQDLADNLKRVVERAKGPVTLVLKADRAVPNDLLVRLYKAGRAAGVAEAWLATGLAPASPAPDPP